MLLKQSTAQTVTIGPILDADGVAVTSAVITNLSLAKNGTAAAMTTETLTHLANGYYSLALTTGNTDSLGGLAVYVNNTAMSMTVFRWNVIAGQVYDSLVSNTDLLQVDVREMLAGVITGSTIAADAIGSSQLAASASTEVASAVRTELTTELGRIDVASSSRSSQTSVDSIGSTVTTISSNVTTLLSRITSGVASMFLDLIQMITGSGTANAQWTAKALENVATATGSGARLVSITVLIDAVAQQSAKVRLTKGAESYLATTNASGLATFNVDDGSWTVSITLSGATFSGATLVVDGNETVSYSLTANSAIAASDPDKVTGYWLCLSHLGVPESGVTVTLTAMSLPVNSTGLVLDSASRSVTSGVDGVVSFTNLLPGVRYKVVRNSGKAFYFVCPTYQADPVDLASFIGT